jgi:histone-lysine N-methyltransferase SETMAR
MACSLSFLQDYAVDGQKLLECIVTGDETWVHHYTPELKRASMQWRHPWSPRPRKFKVVKSAGKVMATVFWDCKGILLVDVTEHGTTVNAAAYCETLKKLKDAIRRKRPGLLSKGVLLLHDNARPHSAKATQELLQQFQWTILQHPAYSPDLAPSDYHLFPALKQYLSSQRFESDDDVTTAVKQWLCRQGTDFYHEGIEKLVVRYDKCLNLFGDYVEK